MLHSPKRERRLWQEGGPILRASFASTTSTSSVAALQQLPPHAAPQSSPVRAPVAPQQPHGASVPTVVRAGQTEVRVYHEPGAPVVERPLYALERDNSPTAAPVDALPTAWRCTGVHRSHKAQVHGVSVHPNGELIATASWDHSCRVYDCVRKVQVASLASEQQGLYAAEFCSSSPHLLGTASSDYSCYIWDWEKERCVMRLSGHKEEVNDLAFHSSENIVATASDDLTVHLWDLSSGNTISELLGHDKVVYGVVFWPQQWMLASVSFDFTCLIWDARQSQPLQTLRGHIDELIGVDVHPSGQYLATGSEDSTVRVWDTRTWKCVRTLDGHTAEAKRVAFSPDGRCLASTSADQTVRVWDTRSWDAAGVLTGHDDHVFDVAWIGNSHRALVLVLFGMIPGGLPVLALCRRTILTVRAGGGGMCLGVGAL